MSDPWIVRALRWSRLLPTEEPAPGPSHGVSGVQYADPDIGVSMSAYGAFPWVFRCASVISQDVSSLPLYVERWTPEPKGADGPGKTSVSYRDPALSLLRKPSPGVSGYALRRQLAVDLVVSGNAYLRRVVRASGTTLVRLHPANVWPIVDPAGERIVGYTYTGVNGAQATIPVAEVAHIRGPNWSDGIAQATGFSPATALRSTLRIEHASKRQAQIAAARGRIEMLFSPDGPDAFGEPGVQRLKKAWSDAEKEGAGVFFISSQIKATQLSPTAKDSQLVEQRVQNREDICGAFGVPPTIAGIPGANHGTAREEARGYWERTIMPIAALFDDAFTQLLSADPEAQRIAHDFTGVVALQVARADQLGQAAVLVSAFGATPRAALDYYGFDDAPAGEVVPPAGAPSSGMPGRDPTEEPRDEVLQAALVATIGLTRTLPIQGIASSLRALGYGGERVIEAAAMIHHFPVDSPPGSVVHLSQVVRNILGDRGDPPR